jgi:hypothetical protein
MNFAAMAVTTNPAQSAARFGSHVASSKTSAPKAVGRRPQKDWFLRPGDDAANLASANVHFADFQALAQENDADRLTTSENQDDENFCHATNLQR